MPRLIWLAGLTLLVLLATPPASADPVRVDARREGDAVLVEARADLRADLHLVWEVLTDYDRYAEFVPDLQSSRVLTRDGHNALVEQRGMAGFFLYRYPLEVQLAVTEEPFERVSCEAVSGNFKVLQGVYELGADETRVHLVYRGRLVPAFRLPPLIGVAAVRASVERQFMGLIREVERRARLVTDP